MENRQKPSCVWTEKWLKTYELSMLNNPYNNLLFDHFDGFEFFLILWVQILSYLPLF